MGTGIDANERACTALRVAIAAFSHLSHGIWPSFAPCEELLGHLSHYRAWACPPEPRALSGCRTEGPGISPHPDARTGDAFPKGLASWEALFRVFRGSLCHSVWLKVSLQARSAMSFYRALSKTLLRGMAAERAVVPWCGPCELSSLSL